MGVNIQQADEGDAADCLCLIPHLSRVMRIVYLACFADAIVAVASRSGQASGVIYSK